MMEVEKILESKTAITSPCFDAQGNLYMCSTQTGDLLFMNINDNAVQVSTSLSEKYGTKNISSYEVPFAGRRYSETQRVFLVELPSTKMMMSPSSSSTFATLPIKPYLC